MTSQEASGSFMVYFDVMKYFNFNESELDSFRKNIVEIDNTSYLPTSVISAKMSEQDWRTMQSEVTTSIFGLKSIFASDLPEIDLGNGITFGSDSAEEKANFEWQCGGYED